MPIEFFKEDTNRELPLSGTHSLWLHDVSNKHDFEIHELNYIFCSDHYLLDINQKYLNHDYYTDIITFDNSDQHSVIEGDIFISVDRVQENATMFGTSFNEELYRVMVHGLLHLIGFDDKSESEKELMREKEEACLSLLKN